MVSQYKSDEWLKAICWSSGSYGVYIMKLYEKIFNKSFRNIKILKVGFFSFAN